MNNTEEKKFTSRQKEFNSLINRIIEMNEEIALAADAIDLDPISMIYRSLNVIIPTGFSETMELFEFCRELGIKTSIRQLSKNPEIKRMFNENMPELIKDFKLN